MARLFYNIVICLSVGVLLPYYALRAIFAPWIFRGLKERFGFLSAPLPKTGGAWVLCASLGETLAMAPFVKKFGEQYPHLPLYISTLTHSGRIEAQKHENAFVFFTPVDMGIIARRILSKLKPRLIVLIEGEIWPNVLFEAQRAQIPIVLVSGRVSEKAFKRWRRFGGFSKKVFSLISLNLMQTEKDAERILALGAAPEKTSAFGNLKFDVSAKTSDEALETAKKYIGGRKTLVAGSVREGEEEIAVNAFREIINPKKILFLVPRHPERSERAFSKISSEGDFAIRRWSQRSASADDACDIVWVDAFGILTSLYKLADAVIVGGAFLPYGGHNVIEPAVFGKPVITGKWTENFSDIVRQFKEANAIIEIDDSAKLGEKINLLFENDDMKNTLGENAKKLVESHRGVTERIMSKLSPYLND